MKVFTVEQRRGTKEFPHSVIVAPLSEFANDDLTTLFWRSALLETGEDHNCVRGEFPIDGAKQEVRMIFGVEKIQHVLGKTDTDGIVGHGGFLQPGSCFVKPFLCYGLLLEV